jgi:hypothetical protein
MKKMNVCYSERLLLLLISLFLATTAKAQYAHFVFDSVQPLQEASTYSYIYRIPPDSVYNVLYASGSFPDVNTNWLKEPVAVTIRGKRDSVINTLPPGHYTTTDINGNNLNMQVYRRAAFHIKIIDLSEIEVLELTDNQQNAIKDAEVTICDNVIPYNEAMHGYILKDFNHRDIVSIHKEGDIAFLNCNVRYATKEASYEHLNNRYYNADSYNSYDGYMVTNKPVYRPHDTVKYKAYILDPLTGKPCTKELKAFLIEENYMNSYQWELQRKRQIANNRAVRQDNEESEAVEDEEEDENTNIIVVNRHLKAEAPGVYFSEFVLGDSIEMDQSYQLVLQDTENDFLITQQLLTEDYLLRETNMKVKTEEARLFQKGDSIGVYAYAFNSNNLPLFDGTYSITVKTGGYAYNNGRSIKVPDTLVHYETNPDPLGETFLGFATDSFPDAELRLSCFVSFTDAHFEKKDTVIYINYTNAPYYIRTWQAGDSLHAEVVQNKKSMAATGKYTVGYSKDAKAIKYPAVIKINSYNFNISFYMDSINHQAAYAYTPSLSADSLNTTQYFSGDTAFLHISNPQHTFFRYTAFIGSKYIGYGYTHNDTTIKVNSPLGETVTFFVQHFWANDVKRVLHAYKFDKNVQVTLNKKDFVYPGESDTIDIQLTTTNGTPIKGTNLTVLAFNSQFEEDFVPQLPYGGIISPGIQYPNPLREVAQMYFSNNRNLLLTDKTWLKKTGTDTFFFYRHIFFSPKLATTIQHTLPNPSLPQLGVHVLKDYVFLEAAIIYIDNVPAYYHKAIGADAQALYVTPGKHTVQVRTKNGQYEANIDAVSNTKLNLFIHANNQPAYYQRALPDTLDNSEKQNLSYYLLQYRSEHNRYSRYNNPYGNGIILQQYPLQVRYTISSYTQDMLVGPFNFVDSISFYQFNNTRCRFMGEANFIFTIREGMFRLEKTNTVNLIGGYIRLGTYWPQLQKTAQPIIDIDTLPIADKPRETNFVAGKSKKREMAKVSYAKITGKEEHFTISGIVQDGKKEPLISAIIQVMQNGIIKGGATTNVNGRFIIKSLRPGTYSVKIQYSNYLTQVVDNVKVYDDKSTTLLVTMHLKGNALDEVVVTAYKVPLIDKYEGPSATMTSEQIEKMPTRSSSGIAYTAPGVYQGDNNLTINGARNEGTQYIVDGVTLRGAAGMDLSYASGSREEFGSDIAGGNTKGSPIIQPGKTESFISSFMNNMMKASGGRKNFRDYAIWQPNLWTNSKGKTSFTITYPDNMTSWKTYVLAMNEKGFTGQAFYLTRSFKPLTATLTAPRFLLYGDSVTVVGSVMNYTPQPFSLQTTYQQNGKDVSGNRLLVHNGKVEMLPAYIPYKETGDTSSLILTYGITANNGYTDGEERTIPVYPQGIAESKGDFLRMMHDTTVYSKPLDNNGFTGKAQVYIDGSLIDVMLREIENLKLYPHGCIEQLTTKLLAISYEEDVKQLVKNEKLNNTETKNAIIEQLVQAQNRDGSFGWYGGNVDYRVTNYVVGTLQKINKDGKLNIIIKRALEYLASHFDQIPDYNKSASLATLSAAGYKIDYSRYLGKLDSLETGIHDSLLNIRVRKEQGLPYRNRLDTVIAKAVNTENGMSWGKSLYDWYYTDLATTLLAYTLVKDDSVYHTIADNVLQFILSKRRYGYYENTALSGQVLTTLLPDLLKNAKDTCDLRTKIYVSGSVTDTIKRLPKTLKINDKNASFSFTKRGISPVFVSVIYKYLDTRPAIDSSLFVVNTVFIQGKDTVTTLKRGEKVILRTTVTCKKDAEYLMLEVPIPAGCIQAKIKNTYYGWQEEKRENYKDRTNIFCRQLNKGGTYTFDIELEPRFKGYFNMNPAGISMMYHPNEFGHNSMKVIEIK